MSRRFPKAAGRFARWGNPLRADRRVRPSAAEHRTTAAAVTESLEERALLTVFTVNTAADVVAADGLTSLREALTAANTNAAFTDAAPGEATGDVIRIDPAVAPGTVFAIDPNLGSLQITDDVVIEGGGVVVDAGALGDSAVQVTLAAGETAVLNNVIIQRGTAVRGGAINFVGADGSSQLLIQRGSQLIGNVAVGDDATDGGGAIYVSAGTVILRDSALADNLAIGQSGSGGAVLVDNGGTLGLVRSNLIGNEANRAGGGIEVTAAGGRVDVRDSFFFNNAAGTGRVASAARPGNGGAFHSTAQSLLEVRGSTFLNNTAANEGGAIWISDGTLAVVSGSYVANNLAAGNFAAGTNEGGGGGIFSNGGQLGVDNSTLTGNQAVGDTGTGGGVFVNGGVANFNLTFFTGNRATRAGGGIEVFGDAVVNVTRQTFFGNFAGLVEGRAAAPGNGGGIHVGSNSASVALDTIDFLNNQAANEGGGFWNNAGSAVFTNNVNFRENISGEGGGLFNNGGSVSLFNTDFRTNLATVNGGGLFNAFGGVVDSDRVEYQGNRALQFGGGFHNDGELLLRRSVVRLNVADVDGGGYWTGAGGVTTAIGQGNNVRGNAPNDVAGPGAVV